MQSEFEQAFGLFGERDKAKQDYLMKALCPRLAFVKDPRRGGGFTIRVPLVPVEKDVTEEEVEKRLREFEDVLAVVPRVTMEEAGQQTRQPTANEDGLGGEPARSKEERPGDKSRGVVPNEVKEFLWDIHANEDDGVATRYSRLGLSGSAGDRLKDKMEREGLVGVHRMNLSGRGGQTVHLELTDKAYQVLGIERPGKRGIGDFEHRLLQRTIKRKMEGLGYRCSLEGQLRNGKLVDVLAVKDGRVVGIEVEMRVSAHIADNIEKDLAGGVDMLHIVTPDMKVMRSVGKSLRRESVRDLRGKVEVTVISRFLKEEEL